MKMNALSFRNKPAEREIAGKIYLLETDRIRPNRAQPRTNFEDDAIIRLADSIRRYGILQPLTVRKPEGEDFDDFELIAGERRLRAAKLLGLTRVPCIILDADPLRSAELAIIENIQREDLNMFEQAGAIHSLIDIYGLTQEQIARILSASQSYVANKLRLLRLSKQEREVVLKNKLSERHARALLRVNDSMDRAKLLTQVALRGITVAQTEDMVEKYLSSSEAKPDKSRRKFIVKDIRIFFNTVEHAVQLLNTAGIKADFSRDDEDDFYICRMRIPKQPDVSRETLSLCNERCSDEG